MKTEIDKKTRPISIYIEQNKNLNRHKRIHHENIVITMRFEKERKKEDQIRLIFAALINRYRVCMQHKDIYV